MRNKSYEQKKRPAKKCFLVGLFLFLFRIESLSFFYFANAKTLTPFAWRPSGTALALWARHNCFLLALRLIVKGSLQHFTKRGVSMDNILELIQCGSKVHGCRNLMDQVR